MIDHVVPIIHEGKNMLFIQRASTKKMLPNAWAFPSGTQEAGESVEATTIRECAEELGLVVEPEYVLAEKELPEFGVRLHFVVCTIKDGFPAIKEPQEIRSISWMTFEEFFKKYSDQEIGHGLIWLRANKNIWKDKF